MILFDKVRKIKPDLLLIGGVMFLSAILAFGLGWIIGSKSLKRPPIIVNCPAQLYETPQTSQ